MALANKSGSLDFTKFEIYVTIAIVPYERDRLINRVNLHLDLGGSFDKYK